MFSLITGLQSAILMLATLFGVAGFSLTVSAQAIPRLPRFRLARREVWGAAAASFLVCAVLAASVFAP